VSEPAQVDLEVRGGVAWITLNRPHKLNALAGDMRQVLLSHIGTAVTTTFAPSSSPGRARHFAPAVTSTT